MQTLFGLGDCLNCGALRNIGLNTGYVEMSSISEDTSHLLQQVRSFFRSFVP